MYAPLVQLYRRRAITDSYSSHGSRTRTAVAHTVTHAQTTSQTISSRQSQIFMISDDQPNLPKNLDPEAARWLVGGGLRLGRYADPPCDVCRIDGKDLRGAGDAD